MSDIPDQRSDSKPNPQGATPGVSAAQAQVPALDILLRFEDLRRANVVNSWKVLREWQLDPRIGFPMGMLLAPNTRRWNKRSIDEWLKDRPVERDGFDEDASTSTPTPAPSAEVPQTTRRALKKLTGGAS